MKIAVIDNCSVAEIGQITEALVGKFARHKETGYKALIQSNEVKTHIQHYNEPRIFDTHLLVNGRDYSLVEFCKEFEVIGEEDA